MTSEKYLELSLDDEDAGKVAEILTNKTAKKIVSLLADKELSQGDIAKELNIAFNTVDYNIKKLLSAGLIKKSKNFFWSVKGKKIPTYKVANRKIVIFTRPKFIGKMLSFALVAGAIGFASKVFVNIAGIKNNLYSDNSLADAMNSSIVKKVTEESLPALSSGVGNNSLSLTSINLSSIFHNVWFWFIIGVSIGVLGFLIYNKLKGGYNRL